MQPRIGTAGWTLPKQHTHHFPEPISPTGEKLSHLQRNSARFNCVEINSSFHRPHMLKTWQRWAESTPTDFRFAVKIPKTITHQAKLINTGALLQTFLDEVRGLGEKLGPLLVQLPPKLAFDEGLAHEFLTTLRELYPTDGPTNQVVFEPRHASWFTAPVSRLLRDFEVARAAADPPKGSPLAAQPAGSPHLRYFRLHGSPRTYYSDYTSAFLKTFAKTIQTNPRHAETWIIFDNTALGHATPNALTLQTLLTTPTKTKRPR
ncbi:MAG: DUF72 domain-containing protein [Acidobacteriota bacterium]